MSDIKRVIWQHLRSLGLIGFTLVPLGALWFNLVHCGSIGLTWVHLGSLGFNYGMVEFFNMYCFGFDIKAKFGTTVKTNI